MDINQRRGCNPFARFFRTRQEEPLISETHELQIQDSLRKAMDKIAQGVKESLSNQLGEEVTLGNPDDPRDYVLLRDAFLKLGGTYHEDKNSLPSGKLIVNSEVGFYSFDRNTDATLLSAELCMHTGQMVFLNYEYT